MKKLGWLMAVPAILSAVAMGIAAAQILGPDLSIPARGVSFDVLWIAFHVGPCLALAVMAGLVGRFGSRPLAVGVALGISVIICPGLLVAWNEALSLPGSFAPTYGALTMVVVAIQYVLVLVAWVIVGAITWVFRRQCDM